MAIGTLYGQENKQLNDREAESSSKEKDKTTHQKELILTYKVCGISSILTHSKVVCKFRELK